MTVFDAPFLPFSAVSESLSRSTRFQPYGQIFVTSDQQALHPTWRTLGIKRDVACAIEEYGEHVARLDSGEGRPHAVVDTPTERHMTTRHFPAQIDFVGTLELESVTVARSPEQQHRGSCANLDASERRVRWDGAHHVAKGGLEPERLFDEEGHLVEIPTKMVLKVRVFGQQTNRVSQETRGGLSSGAQQDRQDASPFGLGQNPISDATSNSTE